MDAAVIEGRALVKRFGATTALDGATFTVGHGITGLLGANGAGKSTLLGLVLGMGRPSEGSLRVFDLDPTRAGASVRARIGYAPEHHHLPDDMRANDFVRHLAELHGLPPREARARASDTLWHVGLGEERFRPISTMSTGQRQRVKLAQAIAHDPVLVLLDEPTDGLDPVQRDEMLRLIRRVGTEFGIDVVISSHLLEEVERVCDGAVILAEGRVLASGSIRALTGGDGALLVEVTDGADRLAAELGRRGLRVAVTGARLAVELDGAEAGGHAEGPGAGGDPRRLVDEVRDAVVATGVGLRRLGSRHTSLEEVFLALGTSAAPTSSVPTTEADG